MSMPFDIHIGRNKSDKEKFGTNGLAFLGKSYVKMGQHTSLSNKVYLDVARSHVILVAGKRGSGKCLHGDTLITLEDGSQIPIKNLETNNQRIISLNRELKLEKAAKTEFFSREVNKLLKIRLKSGREIKLTPEHPLFTLKGWKPIKDLKIGSRIAVPRKLNCFGENQIPEHEIKLLAYLTAEGHTKKIVLFSNKDPKIVDDFRKSLETFDPNLKLVEKNKDNYRVSSKNWKTKVLDTSKISFDKEKRQFKKGSKIEIEKRSIRKLIEKYGLFNKLAIEKYISKKLMNATKENLSLLINRLFSCDGSIYKTNDYWEISYSSSSKKLIKQMQHLLIRFNILSKLRKKKIKLDEKKFISYELVINSENSLKFIEKIGFFGEKEKRQKIAQREIKEKIRNTNIDTIPKEVWEFYKPNNWAAVGRALGYKHPKAMRERIRYAPSRQTMLQIAKAEQHNGLALLAQSDIFWDEIISIEILEGKFKVYDFTVPKNHNFIANDIIVHNSYTLGAIAEELSNLDPETSKNIAPLMFDTMGIFWTMKYKNEKDADLLSQWDLEAKNLPLKVFVPFGKSSEYKEKGIPFDETFALKASELEGEDWISLFNIEITSLPGVLIQRAVTELKDKEESFTIEDITDKMRKDHISSKETKEIALSLFEAANSWGIFSKEKTGTEISDLTNAGTTTVLDISVYSVSSTFNVRALVISLVTKKLFKERMDSRKKEELQSLSQGREYLSYGTEKETPLVWLFIDEAHEFLPREGKTPATDALVQVLREGRQPGISIVLATQQPGQIHKDVMTQSDLVIAHRVTSAQDISALNEIMQTYLLENIRKEIDDLPGLKGSAIILDDNSERLYPIRIRPKFTWHGGEAPTAVKAQEK